MNKFRHVYWYKFISIFLSLSLTLFNSLSYAATLPSQQVEIKPINILDLKSVAVPEDLGKTELSFTGSSDKTVILIQDAHAIPAAQQNIQRLIDYFQKEHGINLVALEGANAPLDPQIFKSFPDKQLLKKVFAEYQNRGELTGGTAASIFNKNESIYQGVEDWSLYEEGVGLYLQAMGKEPQILEKLKALKQTLEDQKQSVYSKELLQVDKTLEDFYKNSSYLLQVLQKLAAIQEPVAGSELALLLQESKQQNVDSSAVEMEVKRIAQKVEALLKSKITTENGKSKLAEFNAKYQEFQTSRMMPQAFALFLKELTAKYRLPIKVSNQLSHSMKNQKRMEEIKGTKLFEDFEHYTESVKGALIKSDDQRKLNEQSKRLRIFERLAQLELSREDWNEVKNFDKDTFLIENAALLTAHLAFYQNAEKRDATFFDRVSSLMQKKEAKSVILVAGGFHTEGLTQRLKNQDISYLLLMPNIASVPEATNYRAHMQGDVSVTGRVKTSQLGSGQNQPGLV